MDAAEQETNLKKGNKSMSEKKTTASVVTTKPSKFRRFFGSLLVIAVVVLGYLYYKTDKELRLLKDPKAQTVYLQKEVEKIIAEISKKVVMTADDKLVYVGTVQDPETLKKEQPFFANASVGDYIFVFEKTGRALLWNADKKIIVNFGVSSNPEVQKAPTPKPEVKTTDTKKEE